MLQVYRKEMEQTDFLLPTRIVKRALAQAHAHTGHLSWFAAHFFKSVIFDLQGWGALLLAAWARGRITHRAGDSRSRSTPQGLSLKTSPASSASKCAINYLRNHCITM